MSLLSLLIALAAEKQLTASVWRFDYYYQQYLTFIQNNTARIKINNNLRYTLTLLIPVAITYTTLQWIDNGLLHFIISTLILVVCFGCVATKQRYKQYLHASFQGETTTTELHREQLLQDKNMSKMSFGQALIWLNYRYYIAIMLFFVLFGATGVVFYRLLTTIVEQHDNCTSNAADTGKLAKNLDKNLTKTANNDGFKASFEHTKEQNTETITFYSNHYYHQILFYLDWVPVRITSFGYMLVGHFSKAFPMWLESLFDYHKPSHQILIDVAKKSEDTMINKGDCSAEPCLLVRLAKRNALLILAIISALTLLGLIN